MKISARIDRLIDKQDSKVKAMASATFDGVFAVHGIRVVDTEKGLRAMMPSNSYTDNNGNTKYSDIFHAITKQGYEAITRSVVGAYEYKLAQTQNSEVEIAPAEECGEMDEGDEAEEEADMGVAF